METGNARILVTGGARGLGRRFVLDLAARGARVGTFDMDSAGLDDLRAHVAEQGFDVWTATANVAQEADVERVFADFAAAVGGLDAVVNNAGITRDALFVKSKEGRVDRMPLESWQQVIDVNLTGVFLCGREAAMHMVRQGTGGVIVSISSISRAGNVGQTNYTASKAGVAGMTVTWAKELARHGIRAAAIAPGFVATEMTEVIREDIRQRIIDQIPLGRMASMAEISHALRFVLENDYVSGRVIEVDGGLRL
ncbi:MAG TPA: SDR family NAD(P)-dependent oxidoreductase [Thermoleophilia bacterium]|nr:SDR family NAD(P)-dependent oxidoreductase [Thermoleophilia bacterium]